MQIIEVTDLTTRKLFLNVCKFIYNGDKNYVRPIDDEIETTFDPDQNPFFKNGIARRWILRLNNKNIGRIAAFINFSKAYGFEQPTGGIGFFECINDREAAFTLFDTAREWLRSNNMEVMHGPINFGENNNFWGLLVEGFTQPAYGMNYNPPYYKNLFESYGFEPMYEQYTNHFDITSYLPQRFRKIVSRVTQNKNYHFEPLQLSNIEKYIQDFVEVYNNSWTHHENFQPVEPEYVRGSFEQMRPVMAPEMIWFAYDKQEPIGFIVAMPDVNQIVRHLDGKMNLWAKLKFLWLKKKGTINRVRVIIMGIKPGYRKKGIDSGLIVHSFDAVKAMKQYKEAELSWVGDFNPEMMALHKASGATFGKKHITYRKCLGA